MSAVTEAIYDTLVADSTVTNALTTFNSRAAIFSYRPVPREVLSPYIFIGESRADLHQDTFNTRGRMITHPIWLVFPRQASVASLDSVAERIRTLFHRNAAIVVSGFSTIEVIAEGPRLGTLEDEGGSENQRVPEEARVVDVRFDLEVP